MLQQDDTEQTPYAWVIHWTTQRWLDTGDWRDIPVGLGPIIVSKQTGRVTTYASAYGTASALELYEEEN